MKKLNVRGWFTLAALCGVAVGASAQESPWFVQAGIAAVRYTPKGPVEIPPGTEVPGAELSMSGSTTGAIEIGYRLTPAVSLRTLVGLPTATKVEGQGSLAPFGKVGELTYGPLMLTGVYEFNLGTVKPYIGGGIAYIKVLKSSDAAITSLDAESGFGGVFQAGLSVPIDKTWGVFLDLRRLKWNSKATGFVPAAGGAPAQAKLKLTADVVMLGVSKQF